MTRVGLFVGVDGYEYLGRLAGAVADAQAMRDFFARPEWGYATELYENPRYPGEVTERVRKAREGMKAGDLLLVYFAGHGAEVNGARMLCTNATPLAVHRDDEAVRLQALEDAVRGPQDTVFIFDACRSDVILEGVEALETLEKIRGKLAEQNISIEDVLSGKIKLRGLFGGLFRRGGTLKRDVEFTTDAEGAVAPTSGAPQRAEKVRHGQVVMLFSCKKGAFSAEFDGHGLFTKALLDEMEKSVGDGLAVRMGEAFRERLNTRMAELAHRAGLSVEQRAQLQFDRPLELIPGHADGRDELYSPPRQAESPVEGRAFVCGTGGIPVRWCPATASGEWRRSKGTDFFEMGSPTDEPCRDWLAQDDRDMSENRHPVCISSGFWIGETVVTQKQWRTVMGTDVEALCAAAIADGAPYEWPGSDPALPQTFRDRKKKKLAGGAGPSSLCYNEQDDAPVYFTNWNDATAFCRRVTEAERSAGRLPEGFAYRLPTEAEWEFACRAGTETTLPNGEPFRPDDRGMDASALDGIAWYAGNSFARWEGKGEDPARYGRPQQNPALKMAQRSVHGKTANAWGIKGMLGNVWEWCLDFAGPYPLTRQKDPCGPSGGRFHIVRGGCWYSDAFECRPAARWRHEAGFRNWSVGFRVVLAREVQP